MESESLLTIPECSRSVPLGIFWDMESCQVPKECSAFSLVQSIRSSFLTNKREEEFVAVCDVFKQPADILQQMADTQVSVLHANSTQKNSAEKNLHQLTRRFAETHKTSASLLIITGDVNFVGDLHDLRYRKRLEVMLIHPPNAPDTLIACATSAYQFTGKLPLSQANNKESNDTPPPPYLESMVKPVEANKPRLMPNQDVGKLTETVANISSEVWRIMEESEEEANAFPPKIDTAHVSEATFSFVVHNLRELIATVESPPCFVRNLTWRIMVRPEPEAGKAKTLGFYLHCNEGSESTKWSCQAEVKLRLVSHKPGGEAVEHKLKRLFNSESNNWGCSILNWSDALNPEKGYIKDNALTFEAHVVAAVPYGVSCDTHDCWVEDLS